MIKTYHKTTTIKAEHFDGSDKMVEKYKMVDAGTMIGTQHSPELYLEGAGKVVVGDWIATGANGKHWPIPNDIFRKTYAELPVIPKVVADWIELGKSKRVSLDTALLLTLYENKKTDGNELARWIMHGNLATVARAWLDGYQVEAQHDTRTD
ncbi:hypothetical protein CNR29_05085 [Levilactobacillus brevis]|uniref:DUF1642 domain-containing protein n=1 Tax=Levilactobacillus brevis TaxID=1580 RepID=A0A2A3TXC7_LEVBR|nr:DUF1642 domain-containing protein [Levilactobacillus brevis]PBQ23411.1 hypothetical protein CNR29_05085 [Levilactobacillus brevis]